MSGPARFSEVSYALTARDGTALMLKPLASADAQRLGEAFAGVDPWATYGYPASALVKFLAQAEPGVPRFALVSDAGTAGAAVIRTAWLRGPYLQFLAILPAYQGRGLGSAFLAWMEREARAAKERNLWVAASEINADGIRFYERHGFKATAQLDGLVYDDRTEILFRKRLT